MNTDIKEDSISDRKRVLVFVLESKNFGIELTKIREITDILPSARLPGARNYVQQSSALFSEIVARDRSTQHNPGLHMKYAPYP